MRRRMTAVAVAAAAAWMLAAARGDSPPAGGGGVNMVHNGSVERATNPGCPDGVAWLSSQWRGEWPQFTALGIPDYARNMMGDEFPYFTLDTNTAAHGAQSLKLTNPSLRFLRGQKVPLEGAPKPNTEYTLSFYAKSEPPGMKIQAELQFGQSCREFTLTGEWTRYTFTHTQTHVRNSLMFYVVTPGTYWLDAVQLEPGAEAGPYVERR